MRLTMTLLSLLVFLSCTSPPVSGPPSSDPPPEYDTTDKSINYQTRDTYSFDNGTVFFSNEFPGARMNSVSQTSPLNYQIVIDPENIPINNSAWYSFYILADNEQSIQVTLTYHDGTHRYIPKLSTDGESWQPINSQDYEVNTVENTATLSLQIGPDTLWVSAQELMAVSHMQEWMEGLSQLDFVDLDTIGTSVNGRALVAVEITENPGAGRHVLVIGRQHPPEISGALALRAFMERFAEDDSLSQQFRQNYVISAVPVVNPDGVDEGHWRHNAHGVDLNRDWVNFNQTEPTAVRDHFLQETQQATEPVYFAVDFHSTQSDVFYSLSSDLTTTPAGLMDQWLAAIVEQFPAEAGNISPSGIGLPTSKAFFYSTFKCPAVIYEVGDETSRDYIRAKARFAATALMELLLEL